MNTLLIYVLKVAVYLAVFYLVYSLLLSRDTAYTRNRAYLIISLFAALTFPLIIFHTVKPLQIQLIGKFLSEVFITANHSGAANQFSAISPSGPIQIVCTIYIIGVSVSLVKLFIDFTGLIFLITRHKNTGSRIIRFHGFNTSGFSALGFIFINTRLSPEEAGEVIKHEQNHLRQNHFIDIIIIELVKTFQWFNPVIYLMNRALRALHEYQADQDCLRSGIPVVNYQSLLLSQVFKSGAFKLTNSFSNPSLIKKRMVMMTKKPTSALANMKLLLVIPATTLVFFAISAYREIPGSPEIQAIPPTITKTPSTTIPDKSVNISSSPVSTSAKPSVSVKKSSPQKVVEQIEKNDIKEVLPPPPPSTLPDKTEEIIKEEETTDNEAPFVIAEEMPMFPGGDAELLKYIGGHTNYPESARVHNIQGRVIIKFCITATGGVSQISVLKSVSPELDAEGIRVVKTLPAFKPGNQRGKNVPVWYMVPITFTLK